MRAQERPNGKSPGQFPRDSGFYASVETIPQQVYSGMLDPGMSGEECITLLVDQMKQITAGCDDDEPEVSVQVTQPEIPVLPLKLSKNRIDKTAQDSPLVSPVKTPEASISPLSSPPSSPCRRISLDPHEIYVNINIAKLKEHYRISKSDSSAQTSLTMQKCQNAYSNRQSLIKTSKGIIYSSTTPPCSESSDQGTSGSDGSRNSAVKKAFDVYRNSKSMQVSNGSSSVCWRGPPKSGNSSSFSHRKSASPQPPRRPVSTSSLIPCHSNSPVYVNAPFTTSKPIKSFSLGRHQRSPRQSRIRRRSAPGKSDSAPSSPQTGSRNIPVFRHRRSPDLVRRSLSDESQRSPKFPRQTKVTRHNSLLLNKPDPVMTSSESWKQITQKLHVEGIDLTRTPYTDRVSWVTDYICHYIEVV